MKRICCFLAATCLAGFAVAEERPNILFAISDDQSFEHTSINGYKAIRTPAFDRIAREGVLFRNAICGSPGCSPSRASLLTGRYTWQIEHAGTHASEFPKKYEVYPDILERAGYFVGFTGKPWGPGNWKISGRDRNPAGPAFNKRSSKEKPAGGISNRDYAGNFADFLAARRKDKPFCFWYGCHEPHRAFETTSGIRLGKKLEDVAVPSFLPDTPDIRTDMLDYCVEIEHFDSHLARMLKVLEDSGELDNTLVVVTSDNGMAFPRAKANCYEYGIHVPLAICWPKRVPPGRTVDDVVGFVDLTATFLEAAGVEQPHAMVGKSLMNILSSKKEGVVDTDRKFVCSARERHSSSRWNNLAYPQRALRTQQYLLIRNFRPERWPAGAPQKFGPDGRLGPMHGGYHDIDACPSLTFLIMNRDDDKLGRYFHLAVDKRPALELFDIQEDPDCLNNLIDDPKHASTKERLVAQLNDFLTKTRDPRILDGGDIFETYKRYSRLRKFPPPEDVE